MIFVGDISLPYKDAIVIENLPDSFKDKNWIGNLEGTIESKNKSNEKAVYNDKQSIESLLKKYNFKGFVLGNNHIFDTGEFHETINFLNQNNVLHCGIGKNIEDSRQEFVFNENGVEVVLINFGWEVIQCEAAKKHTAGVNPLTKRNVLSTVKRLLKKYPNSKLITFMHWSYELEAEPQPFERELAKRLIDIGVHGVIGCHPHRIGGVEFYKDRPIIYSLGNWMFKQNYYYNGKLKFPDFCNLELAFEWDFIKDELKFHFFEYDRDSKIKYLYTKKDFSETNFTPFKGLSNKEYIKWYKENHYHKNKFLPIYYWSDNAIMVYIKNNINKLRDKLIMLIRK